ncbi:MAG: AAC(3) family N-acetyltransferase [Rhodospirillales bacterium]|nr:AAC(3) family N-acetyltransferase [Rhodospirillales bacterium]
MRLIHREEIDAALDTVGLAADQTVFAYCDLAAPGQLEGVRSREEFCATYLAAIRDRLGPGGTLVVPTYTTQVARFDIEFIWEETPALTGIFPEYVRTLPDSLRSIHPLHSVCALGAKQQEICGDNGTSDFGWDSPFHRLHLAEAKILSIGLPSGYAVGIGHYLEAACCLPYIYNKLLKWSPIVAGETDPRPFFSSVRYLDLPVKHNFTRWVKNIRTLGGVNSARLGRKWVHMADFKQVFKEGAKQIRQEPYFLLQEPPTFEYGRIPFDGPTVGRDAISGKNDIDKVAEMNWAGYYLQSNQHIVGGDDEELA